MHFQGIPIRLFKSHNNQPQFQSEIQILFLEEKIGYIRYPINKRRS